MSLKDNVFCEGYLIFLSLCLTNHPPGFIQFLEEIAHAKFLTKGQAVENSQGKNLSHLQAAGLDANQLKIACKYIGRMIVKDEPRDGAMRMTIRRPLPRSCLKCLLLAPLDPARLTCSAKCPPLLRSSLPVALPLAKEGTVPPQKTLRDSWAKVWWCSEIKGMYQNKKCTCPLTQQFLGENLREY